MSNMFAKTKNAFVDSAKGVAGFMLFLILSTLTVLGIMLIKSDILTSYHGYGVLAQTKVNIPDGSSIAWVVSIIPTAMQIAFILGKVTESEYSDNPMISLTSGTMFLWDTTLDIFQMMSGHGTNWQSLGISFVMTIIVYGVMSEILVTLIASSAVGIAMSWIKSLLGDSNSWSMGKSRSTPSASSAGGGRRVREMPGMPQGPFADYKE